MILVLLRRRRITRDEYDGSRRWLLSLNPVVDDEGHRAALSIVSDLADEHRLTLYDAVYLELAIRRRLPLASRDAPLNRAAGICRIPILL